MKKRVISFLLALVLSCSMLPVNTLFVDAASSSDLTFGLNSDYESMGVYACRPNASGALSIPSTYHGYPVTIIAEGAFRGCDNLTSVTIPSSVITIEKEAFSGCDGLTSMTIPNSVTTIGDAAFSGCSELTTLRLGTGIRTIGNEAFYQCSGLSSVTIPNSTISIGSYAFYRCSFMTSLNIGNSVTTIGDYAFYYCRDLDTISIPASVKTIGSMAFGACLGLSTVTIPAGVTAIAEAAFGSCENLTSIFVDDKNLTYCSDERGILFDKNKTTLLQAPAGISGGYTIPDSVLTIDNYAFEYCEGLTSVTIPDSVTNIGSYAFRGCSRLKSLVVGNNITTIGEMAFGGCECLPSVSLPDSVTDIGKNAFLGCKALKAINIPKNVTKIGKNAFLRCSALTEILVSEDNSVFESDDKGVLFNKGKTILIQAPCLAASGEYTVPENVISIDENAFYNCTKLTSVVIPDSVISIGTSAFSGCTNLTEVYYGGSEAQWNDVSIGSYNTPLVNATIHFAKHNHEYKAVITAPTCTAVGYTTYTCSICGNTYRTDEIAALGHTEEILPAVAPTETTAGLTEGKKCSTCGEILVSQEIISPVTNYSFTVNDGEATITDCFNVEGDITIPSTLGGYPVTSIGDNAFNDCDSLTSVIIPDSVTTIGTRAFSKCDNLTTVTIGNSVTVVDNTAYYDSYSLSGATSSDKVTNIGDKAFYDCCHLKSVTIPDNVSTIGESAFDGCTLLNQVYITDLSAWCNISFYDDDSNPLRYGASLYINGELCKDLVIPEGVTEIKQNAFYRANLTSVTIPDSVTAIGDYAFRDCKSLTSVTIPGRVTAIGSYAFSGCTSLVSVTIPDSVTTIGSYAFSACWSLTSVIIGDHVTTIGSYAFSNCGKLTEVVISNSVTSIGNNAFYACKSITSLIIPNSVNYIGQWAFYSCNGLNDVSIPDSITTIRKYTFYKCDALTDVYYGGTQEQWEEISVEGNNEPLLNATIHFAEEPETPDTVDYTYTIENGEATITGYTGNGGDIIIPTAIDGYPVTAIGAEAFYSNKDLTSVIIQYGVTKIGYSAFDSCENLVSVIIPDSVTIIDEWAFCGCESLTNLVIPDSVTSIEWEAFGNCDSLTSIAIPASVAYIGDYAFSGCSNLTGIWVDEDNPAYSSDENGVLYNKYKTVLIQAPGALSGTYVVPDSVVRIGAYAFDEFSHISSVILGENVEIIGFGAFSNSTELKTITIPWGILSIEDEAFMNCTSLRDVYYDDTEGQWESINIGVGNTCLLNAKIHFVTATNGNEKFMSLQEALDAYEGGVIQLQANADSVVVAKNVVVDLDGFSIASVSVTTGELAVLDSKTDDYSVADNDYGKVVSISGTVKPADGYIAIAEADGTSYHRVTLEITDMVLRSADAGVYYNCNFNGDELVASRVASYGVALSLKGTPAIGAAGSKYSVFTKFASGSNTPSTLLKNVMQEANTETQNDRNANMQVYGRAYIQIGDTYIYGETVSRSFRQQVELVDLAWNTLTVDQQAAVHAMYRSFQKDMASWTIPNIKNSF